MKKLIFIGVLGLFALGSCNSKKTGHEGHDHETVTHNHDEHEGHDHETEGHDHEAEGADHSHEGECSGGHDHDKDAGRAVRLPANTVNQPENTATKSFSRKRKPTQPV